MLGIGTEHADPVGDEHGCRLGSRAPARAGERRAARTRIRSLDAIFVPMWARSNSALGARLRTLEVCLKPGPPEGFKRPTRTPSRLPTWTPRERRTSLPSRANLPNRGGRGVRSADAIQGSPDRSRRGAKTGPLRSVAPSSERSLRTSWSVTSWSRPTPDRSGLGRGSAGSGARDAPHSYISHLRKAPGPSASAAPPATCCTSPRTISTRRFEHLLHEARLATGARPERGAIPARCARARIRPSVRRPHGASSLAAEIARLERMARSKRSRIGSWPTWPKVATRALLFEVQTSRSLPLRDASGRSLMLALYRSRRPADGLGGVRARPRE